MIKDKLIGGLILLGIVASWIIFIKFIIVGFNLNWIPPVIWLILLTVLWVIFNVFITLLGLVVAGICICTPNEDKDEKK